jgi:hypothetical protein
MGPVARTGVSESSLGSTLGRRCELRFCHPAGVGVAATHVRSIPKASGVEFMEGLIEASGGSRSCAPVRVGGSFPLTRPNSC